MVPRPRVFITGLGSVTALGVGVDALWSAARDGRTGVRELALPRTANQLVKRAAHLPDFDAPSHLPPEVLRSTDRFRSTPGNRYNGIGFRVSRTRIGF